MKKSIHRSVLYISVLLTLLLSLELQAQVVIMTPAKIWMNQVNTSVKSFTFEFEKTSSLNLSFPIGQVTSEQVGVFGRFQMTDFQSEADQFKIGFSILNAEVLAKNVQIQITIDKNLGFGSATLNLDATCSAIAIRSKAAQTMTARLDKAFHVTGLSADIQNSALTTELIGCTAIAGLDQVIKDKVIEYIQAQIISQQLHQILSEQISAQLSLKLNDLAKKYLSDNLPKPQARLRIDENFRLWTYLGSDLETNFSDEEINSIAANQKASVLIKKWFLEKSLQAYLEKKVTSADISSARNTELQKLTCSRWTQFFVWPSLMALPKCFEMKIVSQVKDLKLSDVSSLKFAVTIQSWAKAESQNKNIAYFNSNVEISLSALSANVVGFSGKQYPEFLNWSGHSGRMPLSQMQTAVQAFLFQQVQVAKGSQDLSAQGILAWLNFENAKSIKPDSVSFQLN